MVEKNQTKASKKIDNVKYSVSLSTTPAKNFRLGLLFKKFVVLNEE